MWNLPYIFDNHLLTNRFFSFVNQSQSDNAFVTLLKIKPSSLFSNMQVI